MNNTQQLSLSAVRRLPVGQRGYKRARATAIGLAIGLFGAAVPWSAAWAKPDAQEAGRAQMGAKSRAQRSDPDRVQNQLQNQLQNQAQAEARAQSKAIANQSAREQRQDAMRQSRDQLRDQVREQQDARRRDVAVQPSQPPVAAPQEPRAGQRLSPEERQVLREQLRAARKIQLP